MIKADQEYDHICPPEFDKRYKQVILTLYYTGRKIIVWADPIPTDYPLVLAFNCNCKEFFSFSPESVRYIAEKEGLSMGDTKFCSCHKPEWIE